MFSARPKVLGRFANVILCHTAIRSRRITAVGSIKGEELANETFGELRNRLTNSLEIKS